MAVLVVAAYAQKLSVFSNQKETKEDVSFRGQVAQELGQDQ
jgi:hypothetical protein